MASVATYGCKSWTLQIDNRKQDQRTWD